MKRIGLLAVIILVAAPAAAFAGSRARFALASLPHSHLSEFRCHTALLPADRSVSVRAVMRPVVGTQKMEMRFELLSRSGAAAPFVDLHGGGLDTWISPPDATLGQRAGDMWIVSHPVTGLPAPADYRYLVSFRWTGPGGRVLATRTRASGDCYQPELRPDLRVSSIAVLAIPGKPAQEQYVAAITNDGLTVALGPFAVTFTAGGTSMAGVAPVTTTKTVPSLDAGATRDVTFVGPTCTASTAPTVVVDPGHTVDEYNFTDNSLTVGPSCPALTSAPISTP